MSSPSNSPQVNWTRIDRLENLIPPTDSQAAATVFNALQRDLEQLSREITQLHTSRQGIGSNHPLTDIYAAMVQGRLHAVLEQICTGGDYYLFRHPSLIDSAQRALLESQSAGKVPSNHLISPPQFVFEPAPQNFGGDCTPPFDLEGRASVEEVSGFMKNRGLFPSLNVFASTIPQDSPHQRSHRVSVMTLTELLER